MKSVGIFWEGSTKHICIYNIVVHFYINTCNTYVDIKKTSQEDAPYKILKERKQRLM